MKKLELPWKEPREVTADGAPSMPGKETSLMGRSVEKWIKKF
jgi:hypothetical protein